MGVNAQPGQERVADRVQEDGGMLAVTASAMATIRAATHIVDSLPRAIYERAPDMWAEDALTEIAKIRRWAEWAGRLIIENSGISQRLAAQITAMAPSTIHRWRVEPMMTSDGTYGPGAGIETDGRRTRTPSRDG